MGFITYKLLVKFFCMFKSNLKPSHKHPSKYSQMAKWILPKTVGRINTIIGSNARLADICYIALPSIIFHKIVHSVVFLRPYTTSFKVKYSLDQSRTFKGPL